MKIERRFWNFLFLSIFLIAGHFLRVERLNRDGLIHIHQDNDQRFLWSARFLLREGFSKTVGLFWFNEKSPYINHPPLMNLYIAGIMKLTDGNPALVRHGISFWVALAWVVVFLLVKELVSQRVALLTVGFGQMFPMMGYFGGLIELTSFVFFFQIIYVFFVYRNENKDSLFHRTILIFIVILGALSDWAFYFWPFVAWLLFPRKRYFFHLMLLVGVTLVYLLWVLGVAGGENLGILWDKLFERTGVNQNIDLWRWVIQQTIYYPVYYGYGWWGWIGGILGLLALLLQKRGEMARFVLLLSLPPVIYLLFFNQAGWIHPYWGFSLVIAVALGWGYLSGSFIRKKMGQILLPLILIAMIVEIVRIYEFLYSL